MRKGYHLTRKEFTEHLRSMVKMGRESVVSYNQTMAEDDWTKRVVDIYHWKHFGRDYIVDRYFIKLNTGEVIRVWDSMTHCFREFVRNNKIPIPDFYTRVSREDWPPVISAARNVEKSQQNSVGIV